MCGIIGYVGERKAAPILIEGLRKLEYRGYDSSGVGVISEKNGNIVVRKTKGKIKDLDQLLQQKETPNSFIGLSHTRWATHGVPNKINAHPHFDDSKKILLVHNGIIENYESLKEFLKKQGHKFVSETDTEVIAQLIGHHYKGDFFAAVKKSIKQLKGAFALSILCQDYPGYPHRRPNWLTVNSWFRQE